MDIERALRRVIAEMAERATYCDQTRTFPYENFKLIVQEELHTVTLSREYGGLEFNVQQTVNLLARMAGACPSTALCLAMHYYSVGGFRRVMNAAMKDRVFRDIASNGEFIASISYPHVIMVRPERTGDMIGIEAKKVEGGYLITGKKKYVSGSPMFKYLPVYCRLENAPSRSLGITALLASTELNGITRNNSWTCSGMKATMSNEVVFEECFVPEDCRIGREHYGIEDTQELVYWFRLAYISVYLGIARRAFDHVLRISKEKRDSISQKPLTFMPGIQFNVADMHVKLETAFNQLMMTAQCVDAAIEAGKITPDLYVKTLVTQSYVSKVANEVVWSAMEIEGMSAMNEGGLLERLYRDVRAATFHPPHGDLLKETMAKTIMGVMTVKSRWA